MTTPLKIQQRPQIRGGLLSVSAPLPTDDWRLGVEVRQSPDDGVFTWQPCASAGQLMDGSEVLDDKPVSDVGAGLRFFPQYAEKIVQCGPGATQTTIGDIARETARGSLDRAYGKVLAGTLHGLLATYGPTTGETGTSLATPGVTTYPDGFDPNAPGNLRGTMQGLLDQSCDCFNSDPVFHIPRSFMPYFLPDGLVRWDEGTGTFRFGPHLVSFDCYPNIAPVVADELASPTAGDGSEVWIFTTTQPLVATADMDDVSVLTREQNLYRAKVERASIVAFDATCAGAAKATVL